MYRFLWTPLVQIFPSKKINPAFLPVTHHIALWSSKQEHRILLLYSLRLQIPQEQEESLLVVCESSFVSKTECVVSAAASPLQPQGRGCRPVLSC